MYTIPTLSEACSLSTIDVLNQCQSSENGLHSNEVISRHQQYGLNTLHASSINLISIFIRQITGNPLVFVLAAATTISFFLGQTTSSVYIFIMILNSIILGFYNEYSAEKTVQTLMKKVAHTALVMRNGEKQEVPVEKLTVGDIVFLSQGSVIPADIRLIKTDGIEINESALTGESVSVEKNALSISTLPKLPQEMKNVAFMGTTVVSGSAAGIILAIGKETKYGKIAKSTTFAKPVTEFQKGLSAFGTMIVKIIMILSIGIFALNILLHHPMIDALLFSLAIAVGLTPELLPVIVTISLSHGAGKLAKKHVIAKKLLSLEILGNMDILCTDKTGTLTQGNIEVADILPSHHSNSDILFSYALICNTAVVHHTILGNGIDVAIWKYAHKHGKTGTHNKKIDEEPFDYTRKMMFAVIANPDNTRTLIAKGAPESIAHCTKIIHTRHEILTQSEKCAKQGFRIIAIASKTVPVKSDYSWKDVANLTFDGYITFFDTPKATSKEAIKRLHSLNVHTKVISGDSVFVTEHICRQIGLDWKHMLTGDHIESMNDNILKEKVEDTDIFVRVNPEQKLRIIKALQANGHTVGYLGDGINDIPALANADVGICVNSAVDVAKDAAAVVILQKSLQVIAEGIVEGRRTFSNTIKYILMSTSSNFGNMFSAAGASIFLPFLPMTPTQILLNNTLYDVSQMSIPSDTVDNESLKKPRHWNISFIKHYMIFFGPISSLYDLITFFILYQIFHANASLFQTGWFMESLATQVLVVFVIRTSRTPFWKSKPSIWVTITSLTIVFIGLVIPFTAFGGSLGFVRPPMQYLVALGFLVATYILLVEKLKSRFLRKFEL